MVFSFFLPRPQALLLHGKDMTPGRSQVQPVVLVANPLDFSQQLMCVCLQGFESVLFRAGFSCLGTLIPLFIS